MPDPSPTVRVFLCATFRDMHAEREYLHTQVFPKTTAWYAQKGVAFEVVDPGWNATEDQAEGFDLLRVSLDQVDQCRPFFIGLIGQRYGRGLTQIRRDLADAYPWVLNKARKGISRMHLEIIHGVLNHPGQSEGSFFYLRQADFLNEAPAKEDGRFLLPDMAEEENRRASLLKAVRASGRPLREYSCTWDAGRRQLGNLESLGRLVTEDLEHAIHVHLFPNTTFHPALVDVVFPPPPQRAELRSDTAPSEPPHLDLLQELTRQLEALKRQTESMAPGIEELAQELIRAPEALERKAEMMGPRAKRKTDLKMPETVAQTPAQPPYVDENVQFTVYRPKVVQPEKWYDLLAIAHLSERRPDAPPDEPDPIEQVKTIVKQRLGEKAREYQNVTQDSTQAIPRRGEITFVPDVPDVEFNPPRRTFLWVESVHSEDFRLKASAKLDGQTARGRLTVFLGAIIIADVPLAFRVDSKHQPAKTKEPDEAVSATPYRKIFASYSHKDLPIVEQYEQFAQSMGDEVLRDWKHLRAGEVWHDKLMRMIEAADVFQLFWSRNSMTSDYVRQEYEHALSLNRPNFVRPTFWEDPMPTSKEPPLPPPALARLHFQRIGAGLLVPTHPQVRPEEEFELSLESAAGLPQPLVSDDSDREFELTLDADSGSGVGLEDSGSAQEEDFLESDFAVPALEEESGSEAASLDASETDLESSDYDLSFEESDSAAEDESGSQVVAMDEEAEAAEAAESVARPQARARRDEDFAAEMDEADEVADEEEEAAYRPAKGIAKPRKRGGEMTWLAVGIGVLLLFVVIVLVLFVVFPDTVQQLLKMLGF